MITLNTLISLIDSCSGGDDEQLADTMFCLKFLLDIWTWVSIGHGHLKLQSKGDMELKRGGTLPQFCRMPLLIGGQSKNILLFKMEQHRVEGETAAVDGREASNVVHVSKAMGKYS